MGEDLFGQPPDRRGSRLPEDWQPSLEARRFAESMGLDWQRTADRFRDYWIAIPGAKGRKCDWAATWRNWCRSESARAGTNQRPRPSTEMSPPVNNDERQWDARLRGYKGRQSFWNPFWGPRPGEPGCHVPRASLARWRASQ